MVMGDGKYPDPDTEKKVRNIYFPSAVTRIFIKNEITLQAGQGTSSINLDISYKNLQNNQKHLQPCKLL
jgi:hypothetical protein